MNEEVKENGLPEEEIQKKRFTPSWAKTLSWASIILSLIVPVVGLGLAIVCISSAGLEEKDEVSIISGVALVISITLLLNGVLTSGMF
jgi:hypothetical protein